MIRSDRSPVARQPRSRLPGLTTQIFIGLVLGIAGRLPVAARSASRIKPLADVFLRMIKMIIAPLLFSTLVVGIAGTGDMKTMGRIGLKAIVYFEVATTIALFLGLALVNLFKPGAGLAMPIGADATAAAAMVAEPAARLGHLPAHVSDLGDRLDGARRHPAGRHLLDRSSGSRLPRSARKGSR